MNMIRYYASPLDRVFAAIDPSRNGHANGASAGDVIRLDVVETPTAYVVKANLPGVAKDQIEINVEDREVTISVEFKDDVGSDGKALWQERARGKATRAVRLPDVVDTTAAQATHTDGVLQLTLPKVTKPSGKITIQ